MSTFEGSGALLLKMEIMKKTLLLIVIFVGLLLCAVGYADSRYRTSIGRRAPALWLPAQDTGAPATTVADNEGRYVLLTFWKSTDAPSRRAANDYTAWLRREQPSNVQLLGVNLDESPELFGEIVRRDSLIAATQYHVGGDTARAIIDTYGLDDGLGSLLIGPDGKILAHNPTPTALTTLTSK